MEVAMMKNIYLLISLLVTLLLAAGCRQASPAGFSQEDLYLELGGEQFRLSMNIENVIAELGDGYEYAEGLSCDYDGLDKTYLYESAEFYTWPLADGDLVNEIYSASNAIATSKGISVGAAKADVLAAYGENCEDTGYQLIYRLTDGGETGALCFDLENDIVSAVYITAQPV
jgi:hypothetical protein